MLASVASMIDQFNMPNIRLLLAMGCEVHVACNFREGNTCDEKRIRKMKKELRRMHVTYHQWDCPRSIYACSKCVRAYWQLCRLLHKYHFSCLHCHSPIGSAIARMAAHGKKIRVIYTAHGFHFYRGSPMKNWMLYYPFEKLLSYWTDCLVTVNREDYHLAKRRFHARWLFHIPGVGIDALMIFWVCPADAVKRLAHLPGTDGIPVTFHTAGGTFWGGQHMCAAVN